MEIDEEIKFLRQKINAMDDEILSLLNRRAEHVSQIGRIKLKGRLSFYDPQREKEIIDRLTLKNSGPLQVEAISQIFRQIISACRALETELRVAFLGPPATFSHIACIQHFGNAVQMVSKDTIQEVFEAVERGESEYGLVPIENSTEGPVTQTLDMFIRSEVKICGEIMTKISHDLLSKSGRHMDIMKIYSHAQALAQCREWLRKHFTHVEIVETGSTAKAAQLAMEDPASAAIASSLAGHLYGLEPIASQIEDNLNNYTRFWVLGRQENEKTGRDKSSILFSIPHAPGTLFRALQIFCEKGINLTKIESRPMKGVPWEYIFFIDFEGHATDTDVVQALSELKEKVLFLKVLGSYPRRS